MQKKIGIPVTTPKWPLPSIFAGACHSQKTGSEHVKMPCTCELAFVLDLSLIYSFNRGRLRCFVFSALDFGECKRFRDII